MQSLKIGLIGIVVAVGLFGLGKANAAQDKGYLGVGLKTGEAAGSDGRTVLTTPGEVVSTVEPGGPADRVGIRQGDVILKVGSQSVSPSSTTASLVSSLPPGAKVPLEIARGEQHFAVTVKLGKRPADQQVASTRSGETPESRAQSFIDDARVTIAADNAQLRDRSISCNSTEAGEGGLKIARVDGLMQGLVNIQPRFPPYMQAGLSRAIANLGAEAARLRLEQADGFLAAGCNAQANQIYRFVLANFSAPVFDGLRQRAQVGIDDVRARGQ